MSEVAEERRKRVSLQAEDSTSIVHGQTEERVPTRRRPTDESRAGERSRRREARENFTARSSSPPLTSGRFCCGRRRRSTHASRIQVPEAGCGPSAHPAGAPMRLAKAVEASPAPGKLPARRPTREEVEVRARTSAGGRGSRRERPRMRRGREAREPMPTPDQDEWSTGRKESPRRRGTCIRRGDPDAATRARAEEGPAARGGVRRDAPSHLLPSCAVRPAVTRWEQERGAKRAWSAGHDISRMAFPTSTSDHGEYGGEEPGLYGPGGGMGRRSQERRGQDAPSSRAWSGAAFTAAQPTPRRHNTVKIT